MTENVDNAPTGQFTITIHEVKIDTIGYMQDVIKFVTWSIEYEKDSIKDSAGNYTTELLEPTTENFTPFEDLTKEQLVSWIEATDERVPGIKNYLQHRVNTEIEKAALATKTLPWVTVPEVATPETVEPTTPPV